MQFLIIYVPSQEPQGQLQTEHSIDTSNYIMNKHNIKSKTNYRQALDDDDDNNNNNIFNVFIVVSGTHENTHIVMLQSTHMETVWTPVRTVSM
jgi:hypothetical protein